MVDDNAILRVIFNNMIKSFPDFPLEVNLFENALDALDYFENKKTARHYSRNYLRRYQHAIYDRLGNDG